MKKAWGHFLFKNSNMRVADFLSTPLLFSFLSVKKMPENVGGSHIRQTLHLIVTTIRHIICL
jgi:hypothetical protein